MEIIPEMPYACERWTRNKTTFGGPLFFYPILQYSLAQTLFARLGLYRLHSQDIKVIAAFSMQVAPRAGHPSR